MYPWENHSKKKDVYFCKQTKVPHTPLKIHMLHMHPVGHEQPSILFARVEEVTFELELISTSKLIPKYCYNIQNAIAIYIYIYISGTDPAGGPDALRSKKKKKISYNIFHLYIYIYISIKDGPKWGPGPPQVQKNFFF